MSSQNSSNSSESFCREWVQMRKYQACVFYMPILLRICRSESTHEMEKDSDDLRKLKCDNQHFHSCYLCHLCYNEKYISIKKNFE